VSSFCTHVEILHMKHLGVPKNKSKHVKMDWRKGFLRVGCLLGNDMDNTGDLNKYGNMG